MANAALDEDILEKIRASIQQEYKDKQETKPVEEIKVKDIVIKAGHKKFSQVFGFNPETIPDIPVKVWDDTDWPEEIRSRIPDVDPEYHWNPLYAEQLAFGFLVDGPLLAHGPTGTGKTSMLREYCALTRTPFFRVSCHKQMEAADFLGSNQVVNDNGVPITVHTHTDATLAMSYGGLLCIDEAFRSPILMAMQSAFETPPSLVLQDAHGSNRVLRPAQRLLIALTDNTNGTGDHTGVYDAEVQDLSTLDRVRTSIYVDYSPDEVERKMLKGKFSGLGDANIRDMVKVANLIRSAFVSNTIMQTMSIRALTYWAENSTILGDVTAGFKAAFFNKLSADDRQVVNSCYRQVYGKDVG